jgi:hypothetical protein
MAHRVKEYFDKLRRQSLQPLAGNLRSEFRKFVGESPIELVSDYEPYQYYPWAPGSKTRHRADYLSPIRHEANSMAQC